jgi:hypothetical protein
MQHVITVRKGFFLFWSSSTTAEYRLAEGVALVKPEPDQLPLVEAAKGFGKALAMLESSRRSLALSLLSFSSFSRRLLCKDAPVFS